MAATTAFIQRVCLRNYKSIAACEVCLRPLTFLVGPNGSGKSNFLDALLFAADALRYSLDHALRDRGGIQQVRRRSGGHPNHFGMRLDFTLPGGAVGHYAFQIAARQSGGYEIQAEECELLVPGSPAPVAGYRVDRGLVRGLQAAPPPSASNLYLAALADREEFQPLYQALTRIAVYRPDTAKIRDLQAPDAGGSLAGDAGNLASMLRRITAQAPERKQRIEQYLARIVPGVCGVEVRSSGPREGLEFRQEMAGADHPWRFPATSMSDGALHALGVLAALFQPRNAGTLVGIDGPVTGLDGLAASAMLDALQEAATIAQVAATTHSPPGLADSSQQTQVWFQAVGGVTTIGIPALAGRLPSGESLLGLSQPRPEAEATARRDDEQLPLFDREPL